MLKLFASVTLAAATVPLYKPVEPDSHAGQHQESTTQGADTGWHPSPPLTPIPAPASKPEPGPKTQDHAEGSPAEWELVKATWVLVAGTIGLAFYTAMLFRATKRLGDEAKGTADRQHTQTENSLAIAGASVAQMRDTTERQLRAYLVARAGNLFSKKLQPSGNYYLEWHPEIINTGQTPAYGIRVATRADIRDLPLRPETNLIGELDPKGTGSEGVLGREQVIWPSCGIRVTVAEMQDMQARALQKAWYVWGRVTYQDIFRQDHWTEFCFVADWNPEGKPVSRVAPHGNDADRVG